ncbi:MAG: ribosome maturation factor RimP, partial [Pisciglobus halotolerans]|nr:ribosome maturation factor RimP [Pisciglobus halotolerans]
MSSIVEMVTDIVTPIIAETRYELTDVEYIKEGKNWFLRIYIDKSDGVDLE